MIILCRVPRRVRNHKSKLEIHATDAFEGLLSDCLNYHIMKLSISSSLTPPHMIQDTPHFEIIRSPPGLSTSFLWRGVAESRPEITGLFRAEPRIGKPLLYLGRSKYRSKICEQLIPALLEHCHCPFNGVSWVSQVIRSPNFIYTHPILTHSALILTLVV